jgi:phosphoglycolate phosphatase-like HAD superfamily hydrolase
MKVIFDLDGTIALIDHRRHLVEKKKATKDDWRAFFSACVDDGPNHAVIQTLAALYAAGFKVIIFSGRSDEVRAETEAWLAAHSVPYHVLRMRAAGDYTPDEQLKRAWLEEYDRSDILCVFDDRDKVVNMWRQEGLSCFQVAQGSF